MSSDVVARSQNEDAAYVILKSDVNYFDITKYNIIQFGNFCAVVPR